MWNIIFFRRKYFYTTINVVATPLWCYGEYTYDCKLKKFHKMLMMTLAHNQHDVIDVIWRLPVWNANIRRYLASCMLQLWYNLTKISFQGKHFNYCCALDDVNMTCRISHFQDGRSFLLNPLVSLLIVLYAWNEIYKYKKIIYKKFWKSI